MPNSGRGRVPSTCSPASSIATTSGSAGSVQFASIAWISVLEAPGWRAITSATNGRTSASVRPGGKRKSTSARHSSATRLILRPPSILPTLNVQTPSTASSA